MKALQGQQPDGIVRDRKWWVAILTVSNEITARNPHLQVPEAQRVNGIWFPYPYRVTVTDPKEAAEISERIGFGSRR